MKGDVPYKFFADWRVFLIVSLVGFLGACASNDALRLVDEPVEVVPSGVSLVEPEPASGLVKKTVDDSLSAGLSGYRLAPGDVVDVLFHISNAPAMDRFRIGVGDVLEIEFQYTPELNRTVTVRPDGRVTLPRVGDLRVAGSVPEDVSREIRQGFANILREPEITVSVVEFREHTEVLTAALNVLEAGRSKRVPVDPSGVLHLPLIGSLPAAGMGLDELTQAATEAYHVAGFGNLKVSMLLDSIVGNRVFVFGEVRNPGPQVITGPTSVAQAIAGAGGPLETAALNNVRIIYGGADGQPEIRSLRLGRLDGTSSPDLGHLVLANSTIYVPPSTIARYNRFVDQYVKQLFLFTGWGIGLSYELNRLEVDF